MNLRIKVVAAIASLFFGAIVLVAAPAAMADGSNPTDSWSTTW